MRALLPAVALAAAGLMPTAAVAEEGCVDVPAAPPGYVCTDDVERIVEALPRVIEIVEERVGAVGGEADPLLYEATWRVERVMEEGVDTLVANVVEAAVRVIGRTIPPT